MGPAQREHDEHDDLLLPHGDVDDDEQDALAEREPQGVEDADELLTSELDDESAEPNLETETGVEGGLDASTLVDGDEDDSLQDDARAEPLEDGASAIDGSIAEDGWLKDSEGDAELYQSEFEEDETDHRDDGGLEGVDSTGGKHDPLHDGLDENALPPLDSEEGDDTLVEDIDRDLLRDLT